MDNDRNDGSLKAIVEALIFASPEPLTPKAMYKILDTEPRKTCKPRSSSSSRTTSGQADYSWSRSLAAIRLSRDRICTSGCAACSTSGGRRSCRCRHWKRWRSSPTSSPWRRSRSARSAASTPRGVLHTLLERHLIKIVGRKQVVGRPFMYATTKEFLIRFGLNDLSELPKVEDMAEALGFEPPLLVEQTQDEDLLPLGSPSRRCCPGPGDPFTESCVLRGGRAPRAAWSRERARWLPCAAFSPLRP